MSDIVIFGVRETSSLAHFYFRHDSEHEVVGFTANAENLDGLKSFEGLPVVAFERIEEVYDPTEVMLFAPLSPRKMNQLRESVYLEGKQKGYRFASYISTRATVFPEAQFGENCFVLEDNTIQPFTTIGDNVVLWSGNHIGHHGAIMDHVFFTSHVVLSGRCTIEPHSFFGVNATIRDGLRIAEGTLVGMGACITRDTEPWGVYTGNPARKGDVPSYEIEL